MMVIMGIVLLHIPEAKTLVNIGAMLKKAMNPVVKKTMREVQELFLHQREKEEERRTRTREGGKIQ